MSEDRFTLAVGAGERLNEHVGGQPWPSVAERHAMLGEAIEIFRELWGGGARAYEGNFFVLDHAELFDLPKQPIPVIVGVSGEKSVALAVEHGDGVMATEPSKELVQGFTKAKKGPVYGEISLAYAPSEAQGRKLAKERFAFSALGWKVNSELPSVEGFEAATKYVREEDLVESIPAGPDPEVHLKAIKKFVEAGFDHITLLGIGPDQPGFIRFAEKELLPRLK
jgi:G6PDH family F420-dependent oxidoreductase